MVPGNDDGPDHDGDHEPRSRGQRFQVPHRDGTRVEVGEAIHVGGERPWMCAVKLVGQRRELQEDGRHGALEDLIGDHGDPPEPTQTLLVRTGRGATAEDARRDALGQLTLVYGSPVEPPPAAVILQKPSDPPPPLPPPDGEDEPPPVRVATPQSWVSRLMRRLKR